MDKKVYPLIPLTTKTETFEANLLENNNLLFLKKIENETVNKQIDFLNHLGENLNKLNNPLEFELYKSIKLTIMNYFYIKSIELSNTVPSTNFVGIIIDSLEQILPHFIQMVDSNLKIESEKVLEFKSIIYELIHYILKIVNDYSFTYIKFSNRFVEMNGLRVLFSYLNNEILIEMLIKYSINTKSEEFQIIDYVLSYILCSISNMDKTYNQYKNKWKKIESVKQLFNYLNKTKDIGNHKLLSVINISHIVDDEDIDTIPELRETIPEITKIVGMIANKINENKENIQREIIHLNEYDGTAYVYCLKYLGVEWSLIDLMRGLYRLAVNDSLKGEIYVKNKINKHIRALIYNGSDYEKEYSLKLLWQLCFDKNISKDIFEDQGFYSYIKELSLEEKESNVTKNSNGILWLIQKNLNLNQLEINEKNKSRGDLNSFNINDIDKWFQNIGNSESDTIVNNKESIENSKKQHIMISYNHHSQDLCLSIKSELEKAGYNVWIDVEKMSGSIIEAMALAVQNSYAILMCMTERYKQSVSCRAEAEYAFTLNKKIIPLVMQKNYKADGWLGIILGSKIYIDFAARDKFSESIKKLKIELKAAANDSLTSQTKIESGVVSMIGSRRSSCIKVTNSNNYKNKKPECLDWTEKEVNEWLKNIGLKKSLANKIKSCDGILLQEIYLLKKESPDFFYNWLAQNQNGKPLFLKRNKISLKDIAFFVSKLKQLFQKPID